MARLKSPISGPFSSYLANLLIEQGCSIRSAAKDSRINFSYMAALIRKPNSSSFSPELIDRIASALQVPVMPLLGMAGWLGPRADVPDEPLRNKLVKYSLLPLELCRFSPGVRQKIKESYLEYHCNKNGVSVPHDILNDNTSTHSKPIDPSEIHRKNRCKCR